MGRKSRYAENDLFSGEDLGGGVMDTQPAETTPVERGPEHMVIDVRRVGVQVAEGVFRLQRFIEGPDYVDAFSGRKVWSIGRNVHDGRIEAAIDARYYGNPNWECLFLR